MYLCTTVLCMRSLGDGVERGGRLKVRVPLIRIMFTGLAEFIFGVPAHFHGSPSVDSGWLVCRFVRLQLVAPVGICARSQHANSTLLSVRFPVCSCLPIQSNQLLYPIIVLIPQLKSVSVNAAAAAAPHRIIVRVLALSSQHDRMRQAGRQVTQEEDFFSIFN